MAKITHEQAISVLKDSVRLAKARQRAAYQRNDPSKARREGALIRGLEFAQRILTDEGSNYLAASGSGCSIFWNGI